MADSMENEFINVPVEIRTADDGLRIFSALTHGVGAILAILGVGFLISLASSAGMRAMVSYTVYGITLVGLYTASMLYHCVPARPKGRRKLRIVDHIMIYVLIAGSYTPICLVALCDKPIWGWAVFGLIWGMALVGSLVKLSWLNVPRWVSAITYIGMGWTILIAIIPLFQIFHSFTLLWMILGGVIYTAGGIMYAKKWPGKERKYFGFHEVFHIFIMLGSLCHYIMMICILSGV